MFWVDKWMLLFLEYCYNLDIIDKNGENEYGQFIELD